MTASKMNDHELYLAREKRLQFLRDALSSSEDAVHHLQRTLDEHQAALTSMRQEILSEEVDLKALREANLLRQAVADQDETHPDTSEWQYKLALVLTLANSAYDALLVLDHQQKIIAINDSAETLFKQKRPIGQTLLSVTDLPDLVSMVDDAVANAEEFLEEQINYDQRTFRTRIQVIHRAGYNFVAIAFQDITDLVRLNRARRDMVANISHELRTPIANIRLIIESLFHEQDNPKRKQSASALRAVARETDSLLWLVQELLDLSMIESGQAILRMVDFPLKTLVDEVLERMNDQSETKDIKIQVQMDDHIIVLADYDQTRRVITNLIHNAIKWSPPAETISLQASQSDDWVEVRVVDRGPGVPFEHADRIFERFYQVDPSRSGKDGTGLGLAICKHIVEAHGGSIWAEGVRAGEKGGLVIFTLPRGETPVSE